MSLLYYFEEFHRLPLFLVPMDPRKIEHPAVTASIFARALDPFLAVNSAITEFPLCSLRREMWDGNSKNSNSTTVTCFIETSKIPYHLGCAFRPIRPRVKWW
jgi:hypothetical protein